MANAFPRKPSSLFALGGVLAHQMRICVAFLGVGAVAGFGCPFAHAADKIWNDTATDFNSAGSWTGGLPGTSDAAVFPTDASILNQPNLTANITIQQLRFNAAAAGYTLSADPGLALRLNNTAFGTSSAIVGAHILGTNIITAPIVLGGAAASTQAFNMIGGGTTSIAGNISEFNAAIKLRLEGQSTGVMRLSGSNSFTGGLILNGGKLLLDYASNATVVNTANPLTLGGGTLELRAASGGTSAQTLGNLTLTTLTASKIVLDPNGSSMALTLGNTWTVGTSALYLGLPTGTEINSNPTLTNGLLPYAVVQNGSNIGFATTSGGKLVRYTYSAGEQLTATQAFSSTANLWHSGNLTITSGGSTWGQTLSVDTTGGGVLNLGAANKAVGVGVLFHGSGSYIITNGGLSASASAGNLTIQQYAEGVVTLASNLIAGHLNKTGPGALVLTGTKTSVRTLRIYEGTVRVDNDTWLIGPPTQTGGAVNLGGGVLELGDAGNLTNAVGIATNDIFWTGDGGFSAYGATREVRLNNGTASIEWASTNFVPANSALLFSSTIANAMLDFQNGLGLGTANRLVRVANGSAAVDARLSGVLSSGVGGGLVKQGLGTLELTASNTYTGETWVTAGTLLINGQQSAATGAVTVLDGATLGGSGASGGTLAGAGLVSPGNSPGILTANQVDPAGGLDFAFEFTQVGNPTWSNASASGNDVQRLTDASAPFVGNLSAANRLDIYLGVASLTDGDIFRGGFFTDRNSDFTAIASGATYRFYVLGDGAGTDATFNGIGYYTLTNYDPDGSVVVSAVQPGTANFASGTVTDGWVQQYEYVVVVPEPTTLLLLACGGGLAMLRRVRRAAGL
jgi:autotransporter-associated beta strand protein